MGKSKSNKAKNQTDSESNVDIKSEVDVKQEEILVDNSEDNNDRPSRNLRKRKQVTASSLVVADKNRVEDNSDNESPSKRKKILVKKEPSSTINTKKTKSKKAEEDEASVEIKGEKVEYDEDEVASASASSASKRSTNKKTTAGDDDDKEEVASVVSVASTKRSTTRNKKKTAAKNDDDDEETASVVSVASSKRSTKNRNKKVAAKNNDDDDEEVASVVSVASSKKPTTRNKKAVAKNDDDDDDDKENVAAAVSHVSKSQANFENKFLKNNKKQNNKISGRIPIDHVFLESSHDHDYHVYIENDDPYDCMLNQTNLAQNNNKYYLLQLLEHNQQRTYAVWFRWGRVGKVGQSSFQQFGNNLSKAKSVFEKKFEDKTKNEWDYKEDFDKVHGKYDLVLKDYDFDNEDEVQIEVEKQAKKKPIPESKLDKRLQSLLDLICNVKNMEDLLIACQYDTQKAPLGKLSASQLSAGYAALKRIEGFINSNKFGSDFYQACSEFYTRIPHDFGMKQPPAIRTKEDLLKKIELLEALADIDVTVKMLNQKSSIENPIDRAYEQLDCNLKPLDHNDKMYKLVSDYLQKTHASTHATYKMKVLDIFEVNKEIEHKRFKDVGNRMLLWHGSRNTNWAGILKQGLRIAPPEAPVTGYMFGKGCYFADCSSKSANYCFATQKNKVGLVSLSEVSLGNTNDLLHADYNADKLPANKSSTKGVGKAEPNPKEWITLDDGLVVPMGEVINTSQNVQSSLLYNEYIVYNVEQIKTRFVVKVEFDFEF